MPTIQDRTITPLLPVLCRHTAGILTALILGLLLTTGGTAWAQPSGCSTVPCATPLLLFSGTAVYHITGSSCTMDVTYKIYDMCGIIEISIDKVSWNADPPCDSGTIGGLIYLAYKAILIDNVHILPPFVPNDCYDGVRGTSSMC